MTLSLRAFVICILLACSFSGPAYALQKSDSSLTKGEAADRARKAENGRVLKVEQTSKSYRVKVLKKSGRVVSVNVDKRSGNVKKSKER